MNPDILDNPSRLVHLSIEDELDDDSDRDGKKKDCDCCIILA